MYRTYFDLSVCIGVIKDFNSVALLLDTCMLCMCCTYKTFPNLLHVQ